MNLTDSIKTLTDTIGSANQQASSAVGSTMEQVHTVGSAATSYATDSLTSQLDSLASSANHLPVLPLEAVPDTLDTLAETTLHLSSVWPVTLFGDTIIKPQSLYHILHSNGEPLSFNPLSDNWVMGILLGAFILLVCVLAWSRDYLRKQARNFFVPSNNATLPNDVKTPAEVYSPIMLSIALCASNGILLFAAANKQFGLQAGYISPLVVLGVCIGTFVVYYLLRWLLYSFINWTFFERGERRSWMGGFTFLMTLESLLFFPIMLFSLNRGWEFSTTLIILLSTYTLLRILLLYHSFRIFFPKIYGILHLFAYLCTLELIPLLILWEGLSILSEQMIVK